jgi:BASS family bile acid:Na+ symporter
MTTNGKSRLDNALHWFHDHFLGFLIASYAIAAVAPAFGLWIRDVSFGVVAVPGGGRR